MLLLYLERNSYVCSLNGVSETEKWDLDCKQNLKQVREIQKVWQQSSNAIICAGRR